LRAGQEPRLTRRLDHPFLLLDDRFEPFQPAGVCDLADVPFNLRHASPRSKRCTIARTSASVGLRCIGHFQSPAQRFRFIPAPRGSIERRDEERVREHVLPR
jgi:hypothetical protein